jgi:hypothetical protein
MQFYKFNNSRSIKTPYYVFIQVLENEKHQDIFGCYWVPSREGRHPIIKITEEEFQAARLQSSAALKVEIPPGEWMVSNEYPHKRIKATATETPNSGYGHIRVDSIPILTNHNEREISNQ